jgi:hypothetical protein
MAWTSLAPRIDALPLILAGPVLRRTEAHSVTVWLALRQPGTVTLNVHQPDDNNKLCLTGQRSTVQMGDNLFLVAVTASTVSTLLTEGHAYCYDLDFEGFPLLNNTVGHLLTPMIFSTSGSIADICYQAYPLPSFIMPPSDLTRLHILHGSCRKPHGGEGERDALPHADAIIAEYVDGNGYLSYSGESMPLERPHQFYHTGDQIYADDVAETLLFMLDDASKSLFGWVESLVPLFPVELAFANEGLTQPLPQNPDFVAFTPDTFSNVVDEGDPNYQYHPIRYSIQPGQRIDVAQRLAGFSKDLANGSGSSHLMRLGEYSCMYLFAWSDVLWPTVPEKLSTANYPTFKQVMPWAVEKPLSGTYDEMLKDSALKQKFDDQLTVLAHFRDTLKSVRRVLANIPSYMMCDDHEVTDDWFGSNEWSDRAYGSELGRRIIQNGLTAFALFQGWGNKPADFETSPAEASSGTVKPASALLNLVRILATNKGENILYWEAIQARILPKRLLTTTKIQGNIEGRKMSEFLVEGVPDYSFCIPFGSYALLAINSRTERALAVDKAPVLGPGLLNPSAMYRQVTQQIRSLPSSVQVTLVLCPAPVFGHAIVEGLLQKSVAKVDNTLLTLPGSSFMPGLDFDLDERTDREGWSFNPECMESFLKELSLCKKAILFSGDVHYGFSAQVAYSRRIDAGTTSAYPAKASFIQLVGSALKNSTKIMTVTGAGNIGSKLLKEDKPYYFAGWDKPGLHHYNYKTVLNASELRFVTVKEAPGFPHPEKFYISELEDPVGDLLDATNDPPRWSYSVRYGRDFRDLKDRFTYNGNLLDDKYGPHYYPPIRLLQAVRNSVTNHTTMAQNIAVGHNQVTQFRLDLPNGKAYHNFWYKMPTREDVSQPGPVTKHNLVIAPV